MSDSLTTFEAQLLKALRDNHEGDPKSEWACVYIDNAGVPGLDQKQKSGVLSSLQKKGLYRHDDEYRGTWGFVRLA